MTFRFNCDEHDLWDKLNLNSIMKLALELHPDEVIQHCADEYDWSEEEVYEFWGLSSELVCEMAVQPSIQLDCFDVIFSI